MLRIAVPIWTEDPRLSRPPGHNAGTLPNLLRVLLTEGVAGRDDSEHLDAQSTVNCQVVARSMLGGRGSDVDLVERIDDQLAHRASPVSCGRIREPSAVARLIAGDRSGTLPP